MYTRRAINSRIKQRVALLVVLIISVAFSETISAQNVAVRNNLLYDLTLTPNLGIDVKLGDQWSGGLSAGFNPWPTSDNVSRKWRHLLIAPQLRYWTKGVFEDRSTYWVLNLIYSHYNVADVKFPFGMYSDVRDKRLQGDLGALGVSFGYTWRLSRLFRMEAEAGVSGGYAWSKQYACGHCGTYEGRNDKAFLMPKLALNLVFDPRKKPVPEPEPIIVIPVDTIKPEPTPVVKPDIIKQLMAENPVLCDISDYRPYDPTKPMRRDSAALLVHFEVDKYDLKRDFRQNAATLDRVISLTRQIVADSTAEVRLIQIIGFASIEGRIRHNEMLGEQRAIALKRYIQDAVEVPDSMFELNNGGEAWAEFRDQIAELIEKHDDKSGTTVAELKRAISIIDNEPAADHREQRLRVLNGGRTWNYIKEHVLADQRNSGYMRIYLERKTP